MADGYTIQKLKLDRAKLQMEHQYDQDIKDLRAKQRNDMERLIEQHKQIKSELSEAYEVELSKSAEDFSQKLAELRANNEKRLDEEKKEGEEEVEKTKSRYHQQLAHYKENNEKNLRDLQLEHQKTEAEIIKRNRLRGIDT